MASPTRRSLGLTALALALLTAAVPASASAWQARKSGQAQPPKPTIVLVHGAWADSSGWAEVTRRLQRRGYTVLVPPNPLRGLSSDADYLEAFLTQRTTGPVILVGHSYGGAVITNAATTDPDVKALMYVDAFVPEEGETLLGLQGGGGDSTALFDTVAYPGARDGAADLYIKQALFPQVFANDLPAATAARLAASQRPITLKALLEPSGAPAWKKLPNSSLVGTEDNILPPALQLFMSERAHGHIVKVAASHLSILSNPEVVTDLVLDAARQKS